MGASCWDYIVPFQQDITRVLSILQQRVFDEGDYYWDLDDGGDVIDRTSLAALFASKDSDRFWEVGTHSILDMDSISAADQPDAEGAIRALSADGVTRHLGSPQPTRADFERAFNLPVNPGESAPIDSGYPKWSGRLTILYRDGEPDEIAFWGCSGDLAFTAPAVSR